MNIRRGMNRLFIVAWVGYAAWIAWYAYNAQVDAEIKTSLTTWEICVTQDRSFDHSLQCNKEQDQRMHEILRDRSERTRQPAWIGLVLLTIIVPPLAAYGVALLLVKVATWVVAGFRTTKPANPD
jgi:hypothetical protein